MLPGQHAWAGERSTRRACVRGGMSGDWRGRGVLCTRLLSGVHMTGAGAAFQAFPPRGRGRDPPHSMAYRGGTGGGARRA